MVETILRCEKVKKHYELESGILEVLKGVTFELQKGELLAIVGISGSGKTTLLNLIFGIDNLSDGEIWIDNQKISEMSKNDFRLFRQQKLGMIFQEFYLIPSMTAIENVMAPLIIANKSEKLALTKAYRLLERVDMRAMANKLPEQLSNGQKQRVAIARAIANDPKILICDEPTRALDTKLGDEIMELLEELIEKDELTVIMTTHDPEVAARANRVLIVRHGLLVEEKIKDKSKFDFQEAKEIYRKSLETSTVEAIQEKSEAPNSKRTKRTRRNKKTNKKPK